MATIQHKRNATAGVAPAAGSLSAGELAVNTADGKVFTKRDNGTVVAMALESHNHTLGSLDGVTITSPSSGQVLKYNGSSWVNGTDETGGGGGSVTPEDDQIIIAMRVFA